MEMSTIKNILSATVILGGACLVYINREKLYRLFTSRYTEQDYIGRNNDNIDAMSEVYKSFVMYADIFQGLYEPMFKASIGKVSLERIKNVLIEWDIRMGSIRNIPIALRGWWSTIITNKDTLPYNELQVKAEEVIRMIEHCGIVRDHKSEIVADNDTNQFYQHVDDIVFETGQKLRVESPCWYLPSEPVRIIEKGYCEIL